MTQSIQTRMCLRQLVFFIGIMCFCKNVFSQIHTSYQTNANTCDCIYITLQNNSQDTAFIISQSNSVHWWDSCFAYTVFKRESPKVGHSIDITYYYRDIDNYRDNNFLYLLPGNCLKFGARATKEMLDDSLFVSMYMCPVSVSKGESVSTIKRRLEKLKKTKEKMFWGWISFYCPSK